jgi:biopolymer transport protein ExbD
MHHARGDVSSKVQLPITAMLDMTFQLLFFFVVNFHPADLEGEINVALPSDGGPVAEAAKPGRMEPDFPIDLTVKVRGRLDREISALFVRDIEGKEQPVEGLAGLKKHLAERRDRLENREAIKIQGDGMLKVRVVIEVMDVCRQAGFANVHFLPPDDRDG